MGVTGLWKLIDSAGKQITLESLEGKIFAVDASILLNQAVKGMKDQPNAHLHILFLRICKLLTYKIKPIFVFDGTAPILKKQTIAARQKRREEAAEKAQSVSDRLKRKAVQRLAIDGALGSVSAAKSAKRTDNDLFELPPLPESHDVEEAESKDNYYELPIHSMLYSGDIDIQQIDITSNEFKSLPLEYQHEILEEIKEHTKHDNKLLPTAAVDQADQFSSFQISKLVKRSKLSGEIESLRKQMLTELADSATDSQHGTLEANRVMSEDATHYLLIKQTPKTELPTVERDSLDSMQAIPSLTANTINKEGVGASECMKMALQDEMLLSDEEENMAAKMEQNHRAREINITITKPVVPENLKKTQNTAVNSQVVSVSDTSSDSNNEDDESDQSTNIKLAIGQKISKEKSHVNSQVLQENAAIAANEDDRNSPQRTVLRETSSSSLPVLKGELPVTESLEESIELHENSKDLVSTIMPTDDSGGNSSSTADVVTPNSNSAYKSLLVKLDAEDDDSDSSDDDLVQVKSNLGAPSEANPVISGLADEILETENTLGAVADEVATNQYYLNLDLQKQRTLSQAITQQMIDDAVELLRLFGIPFVMSPCEAEAQCAKLEELGLCDGTITDDSDVWLFGGSYVLKNFFQQDRYVTSFTSKDIYRCFGLDREKLIALALVCGSDYTNGILGAGPVTAVEIISEFGRNKGGIFALKMFKEWVDSLKANGGNLPASSSNSALRTMLSRHMNSIPETFPNHVVVDAYLKPRVDESSERFAWDRPDLDLLRQFAHRTLNWSPEKVDNLVCPVIKKLNSSESQFKLTKFLNLSTSINKSSEFQSKRLKAAISKLISNESSESAVADASDGLKASRQQKTANRQQSKLLPKVNACKSQRGNVKSKRGGKAGAKRKNYAPPSVNISLVKNEVHLSESDSSD